MPVGPSPSSGNGGLSRQFASASGQMSTSIYSSGLANTGLGAVPPALEIGSDEIDSGQMPTRLIWLCFFFLIILPFTYMICSLSRCFCFLTGNLSVLHHPILQSMMVPKVLKMT